MNSLKGILLSVTVLLSLFVMAQSSSKRLVKVSGKEIVFVPAAANDKFLHPKDLSGFSVKKFIEKEKISLYEFINAANSLVVMADVVSFTGVAYKTSPYQEKPTELFIIADTLLLSGNNILDFSKNKLNANGYLGIFCRVLKFAKEGNLNVRLCDNQQQAYRQFILVTEELVVDNKRVFNNAKIIKERITRPDLSGGGSNTVVVSKYVKKQSTGQNPKTTEIKQGRLSSTVMLSPMFSKFYVNVCDNLGNHISKITGLESFFYEWVTGMHSKIRDAMQNQHLLLNKILFAKKYLRVIPLQKYIPPEDYNSRLIGLRDSIGKLRDQYLGHNLFFERTELINGKSYPIITSISENGINNSLPPDLLLVKPIERNKELLLGYYIYNKNNTAEINIEFDVVLVNESSLFNEVTTYLEERNEKLSPFLTQVSLENLYLAGPDIITEKCRISQITGNHFKLKMVIPTIESPLFPKLFGSSTSDILLKGKWKLRGAEKATGEINIPVSLSKIDYRSIKIDNDSITSLINIPVNIDFGSISKNNIANHKVVLEPGTTIKLPDLSFGDNKYPVANDHISLMPDPAKYGYYFEQIDESDRLTQDVMLTNVIPGGPVDSISGNLLYVEAKIAFERKNGQGNVEIINCTKIKLSPSPAEGSQATIQLMKAGKEYSTVMVSGIAYYENAEYNLIEQKIPEGELVVKLTSDTLQKKDKDN